MPSGPNSRGAGVTLVVAVLIVGAAVIVLGTPDFGVAGQFLSGTYATTDAALALVSIFCWLLILVFVIAIVASAFRRATERQFLVRRWTRAVTFCLAGGMVLMVGIFRHGSVGYPMSCEDCQQRISEATHLAGH